VLKTRILAELMAEVDGEGATVVMLYDVVVKPEVFAYEV
jgi:hypothetical protein